MKASSDGASAAGRRHTIKHRSYLWLTLLRKSNDRLRLWWTRQLFPAPGPEAASCGGWYWAGLALLAIVAGSLLLLNLSYPLLEPDEGRYAEVVREMLTSGDWVIPTLNRQPFYDKPPLFYWLAAGSFRLFGTNEWAARLVSAIAAFLTVLATFSFGSRVVGARPAFLAALALSLMPGFVQCGRIVILDSLLTLLIGVSLFTAYEAIRAERVRWSWWIASSVCCALGVLTKGPIAFALFAPPLTVYVWLNRNKAQLGLSHWIVFTGLVCCLVAPWYVAIMSRDPKFAYHFFVEQHLVRFWLREYHVQPMWYYVPVLLVGCLPWSLLVVPFAGFLFSREAALRPLRSQPMGFFALWAGWCVTFFSISSGKLPPYILPAMPAIALLIGCFLDPVLFHTPLADRFRKTRELVPCLAVFVLSAIWFVMNIVGWRMRLIGPVGAFVQAGIGASCVVGLIAWNRKLPAIAVWLLCCAIGALVIFESSHALLPAWSLRRSPMRRYAEIGEMVCDGQTPVACYGAEWGSIPFYLGRDDVIVNLSDVGPKELEEKLRKNNRYLLVVRHKGDLTAFRQVMTTGMEMTKVLNADEIGIALVENACRARR